MLGSEFSIKSEEGFGVRFFGFKGRITIDERQSRVVGEEWENRVFYERTDGDVFLFNEQAAWYTLKKRFLQGTCTLKKKTCRKRMGDNPSWRKKR